MHIPAEAFETPDRRKRRSLHRSPSARHAFGQRFGFRCYYCNADCSPRGRRWQIDHKTPVSRGGTDDDANLVLACALCNEQKREKTEDEFRFESKLLAELQTLTAQFHLEFMTLRAELPWFYDHTLPAQIDTAKATVRQYTFDVRNAISRGR